MKSPKRAVSGVRSMSSHPLSGAALGWLAATLLGCAPSSDDPARARTNAPQAAGTDVKTGADPGAHEDPWRGLERHEIQLDQKLLVVKGPKGVIGCPYLDVTLFERLDEACAIVPAADTAGMLDSKVIAATPKARALGIEVGMTGREALDKIR